MIKVPGYIIRSEIGVGGMASVYLAQQCSLEREVALKVMSPSLASDPSFSQRFLDEARTLASLAHPNIVSVYDVGVTASQVHYFSMQYLRGGDLARRIKLGMSQPELLPVLLELAQALAYAHQRGIVHRDVSPKNVLFDTDERPVLTDFGIARSLGRSGQVTAAGVSIGTTSYMSPEQARGSAVDTRSDIYSFGVVTYEALTGRPPFEGEDSFAVAYAHVFEPVPRLPPALSHWQTFIDTAMAKQVNERYADAAEMTQALEAIRERVSSESLVTSQASDTLVTAPVSKRSLKPDPGSPMTRQERVNPLLKLPRDFKVPAWLPIAAIGVAMALALGFIAYLISAPPPPATQAQTPTSEPALPSERAERRPRLSDSMQSAEQAETETPADAPGVHDAGTVVASETDAASPDAFLRRTRSIDPAHSPWRMQTDYAAGRRFVAEDLLLGTASEPSDPEESQVDRLLRLANSDLAARRLMLPADGNAYSRYLQVLELEPERPEALLGMRRIVESYERLLEEVWNQQRYEDAAGFLQRARQVAASLPQGDSVSLRLDALADRLAESLYRPVDEALQAWQTEQALQLLETFERFAPGDPRIADARELAQRIGAEGWQFRDQGTGGFQGPALVVLEPGVATVMETPQRGVEVTISQAFAVALHPVTVAEFSLFVSDTGHQVSSACRDKESMFRSSRQRSWRDPGFAQQATHPVVCVAWDDAQAYVRWLSQRTGESYRLPSESEWAHATQRLNPPTWRGCAESPGRCVPTLEATRPAFTGEAADRYDVAGWVREWLQDCARGEIVGQSMSQQAYETPRCNDRLARGLAWYSDRDQAPLSTRSAIRATIAANGLGFRVVREMP